MKRKKKLRGLKYASTPNLPYFENYDQYGFGGWLKENAGEIGGIAGGLIGSLIAPGVGTAIGGSIGSGIGRGIEGSGEDETILPEYLARKQALMPSTNIAPMRQGGCMPCLKSKVYARGGRVQGGYPREELTTYEGSTHEQGGIPLGPRTEVETGESRFGDMILSDMPITQPMVKRWGRQYGGPAPITLADAKNGTSMSDVGKRIDRKFDRYAKDKLNELSRGLWLGALSNAQGYESDEGYDNYGGYDDYGQGQQQEEEGMMKKGGWIQKAVNPKHKGYCTPMTKKTCTPHRKALAKRFKSGEFRHKKQHGGPYSVGSGYAVPGPMPEYGVIGGEPETYPTLKSRGINPGGFSDFHIANTADKYWNKINEGKFTPEQSAKYNQIIRNQFEHRYRRPMESADSLAISHGVYIGSPMGGVTPARNMDYWERLQESNYDEKVPYLNPDALGGAGSFNAKTFLNSLGKKKMGKGGKIEKVMHEYKQGKLYIGNSDKIVKNRKQAIAIALSEAGRSKKAGGGSYEPLEVPFGTKAMGYAPIIGQGVNVLASLFEKPDKVDYPNIPFEPTTPTFMDNTAEVRGIESTYAGATEGMRRTSPQNYLNRLSALSTGRSRAISEATERNANANAMISNQTKEQNARLKTYTDMRNAEVGRMENIDEARNEAALRNLRFGEASELWSQFGEAARDKKLGLANEAYNKSWFNYLDDYRKSLLGGKEEEEPTTYSRYGGSLRNLSKKRRFNPIYRLNG